MSELREAVETVIREFDYTSPELAVRRLKQALAAPEWHDMESAPKDGTEIKMRKTSRVRWAKPGYWNENPFTVTCEWSPITQNNPMPVEILNTTTTLDIDVDRVLDSAKGADVVLVISWRGDELHCASSTGDVAEQNYMVDRAKIEILDYSMIVRK